MVQTTLDLSRVSCSMMSCTAVPCSRLATGIDAYGQQVGQQCRQKHNMMACLAKLESKRRSVCEICLHMD